MMPIALPITCGLVDSFVSPPANTILLAIQISSLPNIILSTSVTFQFAGTHTLSINARGVPPHARMSLQLEVTASLPHVRLSLQSFETATGTDARSILKTN